MSSSLTKKQKLILLVIGCVVVIGGLMGAIIYGVNQVKLCYLINAFLVAEWFSLDYNPSFKVGRS